MAKKVITKTQTEAPVRIKGVVKTTSGLIIVSAILGIILTILALR